MAEPTDPMQHLLVGYEALRKTVEQLQNRLAAQEAAIAELRANRPAAEDPGRAEVYLKSLYAMTRREFTFTPEEIRDLDENGVSLEQVIREIEEELGGKDGKRG